MKYFIHFIFYLFHYSFIHLFIYLFHLIHSLIYLFIHLAFQKMLIITLKKFHPHRCGFSSLRMTGESHDKSWVAPQLYFWIFCFLCPPQEFLVGLIQDMQVFKLLFQFSSIQEQLDQRYLTVPHHCLKFQLEPCR